MDGSLSPRLLQRERIIQIAGLLLMVSPFFNFFVPVALLEGVPNKWSVSMLWQIARAGSMIMWGLSVANIVIGFMMLKGRRASWVSVLVVLGFFIVYGVATLKRDMKSGWVQPVTLVLINIGLFGLIYSQEFFQIRQMEEQARKMAAARKPVVPAAPMPARAPAPMPAPAPAHVQVQVANGGKAPLVELEGFGTWARLLEVSSSKIIMRAIKPLPTTLEGRTIEMSLGSQLKLRVRLATSNQKVYEFVCVDPNEFALKQLNHWMEERLKMADYLHDSQAGKTA